MDIFLLGIAVLIIAVGFIGLVFPALPGLPLIWAGMFFYGFLTGFTHVTGMVIFWLGAIAIIGQMLEYSANLYGAKKFGASKWGMFGVIFGLVIGIAMLGPFGVIAGPACGACAGELLGGRGRYHALRASVGALAGFLGGLLVQTVLAFVMLGIFFTVIL